LVGLLSPGDYAGYADEGRRLAVDVPNVTPMDAARFIAEATPIIGDAMAAKEIYDEATSENPNWALVGALGGAAVLGLFPGIGDAAAKAVKSGARGLLDTAKRVEVDPNAMGSLLGNVRLKPKGDIQDIIQSKYPEVSIDLFGDSEKGYELSRIVVPKGSREQGTGTKVMEDILSLADAQGARVSLTPDSAFGGSKPRLKKFYKKFGFVDNKGSNKDFTTRNTMYRDPVTPTPSPAQEISGLLASGRADEVTDEMLGKLTPNDNMELFELYQSGATGMDLPMDEASRMARAESMFPRGDSYHGTNADIKGFQGNVFSSDNPTLASTYARGSADAQIYPLRLGSKLGDTVVEGGGVNWSQLNIDDVKDPAVADWLDWAEGQKISTREIEQAASREGRSGVQFKDISDTGPGFNSNQFKNLGYTKEQERDLQRQYMEDLSKPSNVDVRLSPNLVRSKFARFDPRLSNLKNLSAALASVPGGLLALQEMQKRANEEQQRQGLLQ
jgi:predicted GNAT family N-acyltransferase